MYLQITALTVSVCLAGCYDAFNPQPTKMTSAREAMAELKWKRRVLIFSAPRGDDAELKRQAEWVVDPTTHELLPGFTERRLTVVSFVGPYGPQIENYRVGSDDLRKAFRMPADRFEVVLIGLDGEVKRQESKALTVDEIFATIDAMPMRRQEVQASGPAD